METWFHSCVICTSFSDCQTLQFPNASTDASLHRQASPSIDLKRSVGGLNAQSIDCYGACCIFTVVYHTLASFREIDLDFKD